LSIELPERVEGSEDEFVGWCGQSLDTDDLIEVISAAMDARRPRLAARLVGLLDEHVEIEPGTALDRARRAARLVLTRKGTPESQSWSALEEAWGEGRRRRMRRIRMRMRDRLEGKNRRIGRHPKRSR